MFGVVLLVVVETCNKAISCCRSSVSGSNLLTKNLRYRVVYLCSGSVAQLYFMVPFFSENIFCSDLMLCLRTLVGQTNHRERDLSLYKFRVSNTAEGLDSLSDDAFCSLLLAPLLLAVSCTTARRMITVHSSCVITIKNAIFSQVRYKFKTS